MLQFAGGGYFSKTSYCILSPILVYMAVNVVMFVRKCVLVLCVHIESDVIQVTISIIIIVPCALCSANTREIYNIVICSILVGDLLEQIGSTQLLH